MVLRLILRGEKGGIYTASWSRVMNQLLGRNFDSTAARKLNKLDKTDKKCLTWDLKTVDTALSEKLVELLTTKILEQKSFWLFLK